MKAKVIYSFEIDIPDIEEKDKAITVVSNINWEEVQTGYNPNQKPFTGDSAYQVYVESAQVVSVEVIQK